MPEPIEKEVVEEEVKEVVEEEVKEEVPTEEPDKEEESPEEESDEFDESNIDEDVKNYKPEPKAAEDDEEIDEDDKKRIEKIVEKKYGGDIEAMKKQTAITTYFSEHPEYSKYKGAAMKYMDHPTYSGIPIHNIVAIVASKDMMKIGAAKEREAQKRVAETKVPGKTVRKPSGGGTDWSKATKEELEAQKAKIYGRE